MKPWARPTTSAATAVGNTSATLSFSLTREADEKALARGSFVQVFVDRETRRPTPVPESVRFAFEKSIGALSGAG